ncbi:hypothetical protein BS17DRAFT_763742 [Gyrodon lividus]|nr:hypothetical protein BS17DRAFT_763742 [Gyrodon lividus]
MPIPDRHPTEAIVLQYKKTSTVAAILDSSDSGIKLPGHIETLDIGIGDCIATVEEPSKLGISECGRQLIKGGSHGGFITGHHVFKAAVMQNPVTSLDELVASSDIPDFPFVEMGIPYPPGTCVTPGIYQVLYEAPPIAHVDEVRTPVLLIVGEDDH